MASAAVNLPVRKDNQRELVFAHRPLSGFFFAVIGFVGAYFLFRSHVIPDKVPNILFSSFLVLFGLLGVIGIFWRFRIEVNLLSRTYWAVRGFWPAPKKWRGSVEDFEGVILTVAVIKQDKGTRTVWTVSLGLKGLEKPPSIFTTTEERKAYEKLEYYSQKLMVKAIDRTGSHEKQTDWNELDRTITEGLADALEIMTPPAHMSGIEFHEDSSGTRIVLPAGGFSFGALLVFLFGLPFASIGLLVGWMGFFHPEKVHGATYLIPIFVVVFVGAGCMLMLAACYGIWGRETIIAQQNRIMKRGLLFGKIIGRKVNLLKKEIEEVTIKPVPAPRRLAGKVIDRYELFVRSDKGVMHIGAGLSDEKLQWLKNALLYLVRR